MDRNPDSSTPESSEFDDLELPDRSVRGLLRHFGPGIILMMTGIGTSHLVTAPTAGGRFAYALLWCLPVAYVLKYYAFEAAFRFTNATGKSLIEAYATAPRKWPLWYVLTMTLIQCAIGQAGRLVAAAAVVYYVASEVLGWPFSLTGIAVTLGVASVAVLLYGRYEAVENSAKVLAAVMVASTLAVYAYEPAPLAEMGAFFLVEIPDGSWLVVAALVGLLPTGVDVSLQASEWGKAKKVGMSRIRDRMEELGLARSFDAFRPSLDDLTVRTERLPARAREYCRRWFRIGLWDFRLGHAVSFLMAAVFMLLAAVWLYPNAVEGTAVMGEIAGIFTNSMGPNMMGLFMVGAFAATFSTAFNYFDGWPRIVGACCRNLFRGTARASGIDRKLPGRFSEYNVYRATMIYSLVGSTAVIAGLPRPVYLVLVSSALALFVAPVIFFLNLRYCLAVIPKEDRYFHPSAFARWFGWICLIVFTGVSVALVFARF